MRPHTRQFALTAISSRKPLPAVPSVEGSNPSPSASLTRVPLPGEVSGNADCGNNPPEARMRRWSALPHDLGDHGGAGRRRSSDEPDGPAASAHDVEPSACRRRRSDRRRLNAEPRRGLAHVDPARRPRIRIRRRGPPRVDHRRARPFRPAARGHRRARALGIYWVAISTDDAGLTSCQPLRLRGNGDCLAEWSNVLPIVVP